MWFGASILFRAQHLREKPNPTIWEDSIIVVQADSLTEATELATAIGLERQVSYAVMDDDWVDWVFDSVLDVFEIEDAALSSGVEVFSRHLTEDEVLKLKQPIASSG